ncbi:hypothetical protein CXB51_028869 [Gossypium anomalum]|uniref:Uncharacterized protein n=1 Tax=Gossypium anomalum TaxID=47600 RepID=A0A8J5YKW7_9ROSI|nr:hypothetical protein CXB51_028869 [Gossypium anomalum]
MQTNSPHSGQDKMDCAIKQTGAPLPQIKFENTVSAFKTLPQKGI